jgi:hypothetical protein
MCLVDVIFHLLELLNAPFTYINQSLHLLSGFGVQAFNSFLKFRLKLCVIVD